MTPIHPSPLSPPVPTYISSCFWTYPTLSDVEAGHPLEFSVVVPPPLTLPAGTVVFPVAGSAVAWILQHANGQQLVPGDDYVVLEGDLASDRLSVVFKPPATDTLITVVPNLTLFYAGAAPEIGSFSSQGYTLKPVTDAALARARSQITKSLSLVAENTVIEPGSLALLRVVTQDVLDIPQVATSIVHETPHVQIKGAIPLDSIIQAFLSPVSNALGQFVPGSKSTVTEAGLQVQKLLGGLFSIPIAIDVLGDKLTKTLLPTGMPELPTRVSASPDGQSIAGTIPIGRWPAVLSTTTAPTWTITENGTTTAYNDVSPGVNLVKSFLLRPDLVAMSTAPNAMAPKPVAVTVTLHLALDANPVRTFDIPLPSVTLQRLPLLVPQIAAVFKHAFDDVANAADQQAVLTTDLQTASFLSSVNDCLDLIVRTTSVLNKIVAVATTLDTDWKDVLGLATGMGVLAQQLGAIPARPGSLLFQPCLCGSPGPCVRLKGAWNKAISAIVVVGPPATNQFVLSDGDGYIAFNGSARRYYSVIPNLDGVFSNIVQQPFGSAVSNQPSQNLNDALEVLGYGLS